MDLVRDGLIEAVRLILRADPELRQLVLRSLIVLLTATALAAVVGVPVGVALAIGQFHGRALVLVL